MLSEYAWIIVTVVMLTHVVLGTMVMVIMAYKGYKGDFFYFFFGLFFGMLAFLCVIGMPITRAEQAVRDKELVRLMLAAQGITVNEGNDEDEKLDEDAHLVGSAGRVE